MLTATATHPLWLIGSSGMLAGELLRLLSGHSFLRLAAAVSRTPGQPLSVVQPHLPLELPTRSLESLDGALPALVEAAAQDQPTPVVILALPHGESVAAWARLRQALGSGADRIRLVDLAADFRLRDPLRYQRAYGRPHAEPRQLAGFAYGLPEWNRDGIVGATRVAAPGCFATALQLATLPAARAGLLDVQRPWIFHAVTGSSGSGATPSPRAHHPHRHGNLHAYALAGHRHEAELEQALAQLGLEPALHFLPHSGPFARGIHLSAALPLRTGIAAGEIEAAYAEAYRGAAFVQLLAGASVPELRRVVGSNRCELALHQRGAVLTVLCALDNLVKGGVGQALQCLNLMLGLPEEAGLPAAGLGVA